MKKLDKYFFKEDTLPKSHFRDYLNRFEEYKKFSLSSPMNFILMMVFSIGLVVVVILNDYRNAMIVGTPIVLSLVETFLIGPALKNKKKTVEMLELDIDNSSSAKDFKNKVHALHVEAYRYGYLDILARYVYASLMILTVYFTMKICSINSFPFIIFYSCISVALYKSLDGLLSFEERMNRFNIVKVKLSNSINSLQ